MTLAAAAPLWAQVANFFFLLAALFDDMLLVRLWLAFAFVALLIMHIKSSFDTGELVLDGLMWVVFTGIWHWQVVTLAKGPLLYQVIP